MTLVRGGEPFSRREYQQLPRSVLNEPMLDNLPNRSSVGTWCSSIALEKAVSHPFPKREELEALANVVEVSADRLAEMLPPLGQTMKPRPSTVCSLLCRVALSPD
jgi:hypothetical protein